MSYELIILWNVNLLIENPLFFIFGCDGSYKDIIVISKAETSVISTRSDKIEVGLFGDIDGLSLEFGAEAKYNSKATQNSQVSPDESTIVANGNVNMTSGSSIYLEGDVAAGNNINLKSKDIIILLRLLTAY